MKRLEDMTEEELREFVRLAAQTYVDNSHPITPYQSVSIDILNQLTNYNSRN